VQVAILSSLVAAFSAFMNNVGALAIFLPVALQVARRTGQSPSTLLMPLSFGSLLGGLITRIGTPPNILISGIRRDLTGQGFEMFDFAPVGLGVAAAGIAVLVVGWRVLPHDRRGERPPETLFRIEDYVSEVRLPPNSPMVGRTVAELEELSEGEARVTAIIRERFRRYAASGDWTLLENDVLVVESDPHVLKRLVDRAKLDLVAGDRDVAPTASDEAGVVEAVIMAGSPMAGCTPAELRLRERFGVNLVAVSRRAGRTTARLRRVKFQAGDVVALQGNRDAIPDTLAALGCLPLAERRLRLGRPRRIVLPPLLMAAAVALAMFDVVPISIAFLGAVVAVVLLRVLTLREVYDAVVWPVVVLLGALIPVSEALRDTGGTELIAGWLSGVIGGVPAIAALALTLVATMLVTPVLNNAATVLVMAPIAASFAGGLGLSIDPFLMAVAVGASSDFLTPIGHQSNTLVMGPGGYRFGDYWRLGLPVSIAVVAAAVPLIALVWPLR
ncbi:MAG TPA: SLC13 family permease, partial [Alphaproteobacteria bacterium]|nr:SLC13 family permease [Alphaproteobacteria bacterium]